MSGLVSILIPCYNAEPWLADSIKSALAQTCARKEIIVVNDGSQDGSLALAQRFESGIVKIVHQENAGASAARNRAYSEAQGEVVQYLDADDLLAPDKIENQLRLLEQDGMDCVAACRWGRFHTHPEVAWFVPEPFWTTLPPVDWLVNCWERASMMHPAAWLVPRSIIERAGPWDESLSLNDDGEFFCRAVLASRMVLFSPSAVSYYRSGLPTSLSGAKSASAWDSAYRSVELGTANLLAVEDSPRTRRASAVSFQNLAYSMYPDVPRLSYQAEQRAQQFGGCDFPCPGGKRFRFASRLIGWRAARRLQRLVSR